MNRDRSSDGEWVRAMASRRGTRSEPDSSSRIGRTCLLQEMTGGIAGRHILPGAFREPGAEERRYLMYASTMSRSSILEAFMLDQASDGCRQSD